MAAKQSQKHQEEKGRRKAQRNGGKMPAAGRRKGAGKMIKEEKRVHACVCIKPSKKICRQMYAFFEIWPARWAGFLNVHACMYILNTLPAAAGKKKWAT